MTAKRLLDAAALFNAARGVITQHGRLINERLETYEKTSSLVKAVRSRTSRRNPQYSTRTAPLTDVRPQGVKQDHFYTPSQANSAKDAPPSEDLDVKQKLAASSPLPDGTIPPAGANTTTQSEREEYNEPPKAAPAKHPVTNEGDIVSAAGIEVQASGRSSIPDPTDAERSPSSTEARKLQRESEAQIPSQVAQPPPAEDIELSESGLAGEELSVDQEKDVYYIPSSDVKPVRSSLPRVKLPKKADVSQGGDEHVPAEGINQEVFYSHEDNTPEYSNQTVPHEDGSSQDLPESTYSQIFHNPRLAKMMRKGITGRSDGTNNQSRNISSAARGQPPETAVGKVAATTNSKSEAEEMKDLAANIAQDAKAADEHVRSQERIDTPDTDD